MEKVIYFAGECFWGTEHFFQLINGVTKTQVGYANGITENPSYKEVCTNTTQHAETVMVTYDPERISLRFLVEMYFKAIDPTLLNQQGHDVGTQYRTGIFYTDEADVPVIREVYAEEQKKYDKPLVTEVEPLNCFYTAEDYHQDYLNKNPEGYCHLPLELFEFAKKANQ